MSDATTAYFDSALIAKFYLNEPGRDTVRGLALSAGQVASSAIAVAEVSSAFHRKLRERAFGPETFKALQGQFAHDLDAGLWTLIPTSDQLLKDVHTLYSKLPATTYLRSLDAIHLATAKSEKFDCIYSNDSQVLTACKAVGLDGVNPLA